MLIVCVIVINMSAYPTAVDSEIKDKKLTKIIMYWFIVYSSGPMYHYLLGPIYHLILGSYVLPLIYYPLI